MHGGPQPSWRARGWEQQAYRDRMAAGPSPHGADCRLHHLTHPQLWGHQFLPEGWVGRPAEPSWAGVPGCPPSPPSPKDFRARWTILQPKKGFPTGEGFESSASSYLLSSSGRSKKFDNENGADDSANCLRDGMAAWGWGDGMPWGFKTADECPAGYFASSEGDGRGLSAEPGNTLHRWVSRSSTS